MERSIEHEFFTSILSEDDSFLEKTYGALYNLNEFTDPANYKTYDELKDKLGRILGENTDSLGSMNMKQEAQMNEPAPAVPLPNVTEVNSNETSEESDDDTMSYFAKLAKEA